MEQVMEQVTAETLAREEIRMFHRPAGMLPDDVPLVMETLSKAELDHEILRGMEQIWAGQTVPAAEVERKLLLEMGL